jgi:serine/threonine protein kinase
VKTDSLESLGRYLVEAEIGRGAMGVVYRARDPKIDRLVAIKTISLAGQEPEEEEAYRERFSEEARAAGRLSHPGIVTVFDAGEDPETHEPFLVMEFVAGKPLNKVMAESSGKLPLGTALQFAYEIAEALDYAHCQGVIHRDIKPANILIGEDGHAKITDFGVARINRAMTTAAGGIFGSPAYMAPEQLSGGPVDGRADLFSLGVVLYSMITGFRPFQGNSAQTVCFKVANVEPVPVTSFRTDMPPAIDAIVSRAIAKEPRQRYQSGAEMASDIQNLIRDDASIAEATSFFTRSLQRKIDHSSVSRKRAARRLLWQGATLAMATVWALTGWQVKKEYAEAAAIPEPSIPSPKAPMLEKMPPLAHVIRTVYHHKPKPAAAAAPARLVETTKMRVEILHHFSDARASIWLDDQLIFDEQLHGDEQRHPIFRTVEMNQMASLQFAAGKHSLHVHVFAPDKTYDQNESIEADLASGREHTLLVNCDKRKMLVNLR